MRAHAPRVVLAVAACLVVLVHVTGLGLPFNDSDESIYAEFVRAMHRSGDYFTLRYQGAENLQRPPTAVTMYALAALAVPGEVGLRLVPALLSALAAVLVGVAVWRWTRRLDMALLGLLLAAGIPSAFTYGRLLMSDPPLVVACVVALLATMAAQDDSRWLPWAGVGAGAAFAVKSLAAAIPLAALAPWLLRAIWVHRHDARIRRRVLVAVLAFAGLAAPFYVYHLALHPERFWDEHMRRILFDRVRGYDETIFGIPGPLSYVKHMLRADGVLVTAILGAGMALSAVLSWVRRDARLGVAATYAIVVLVGLSAVGTRLPHYLLIFFPAAALCTTLCAAWLLERVSLRPAVLVAPALGATLLATTLAAGPVDRDTLPAVISADLGARATAFVPPGAPVYSLNWYAPALGVYADRPWHMLNTDARVAAVLADSDPFCYADNIHVVPPWPEGELIIAAPAEELARAPGLVVLETLAVHRDTWLLVRARGAAHTSP